ncbi:hypothetical protein CPB84DRAFT_1771811 [Gymnopilus junonius]|uniref:Peptidase S1 domain-containing protein n=1 Tax=Gymnopilus junonius TaxID=109634 RepID=A0A9P5TQD3_GYMJU|nr:hypothetical protein CPB84DRAFT_1771811 [Gymnopilus junonius]
MWTTIDVVRFVEVESASVPWSPGPPVLWIGVKPGSLSRQDAQVAVIGCEELLKKFELTDVEIAFRESLFTRLAPPKLLKYVSSHNATAPVRGPLTPALGFPIAADATPSTEGTGTLYIRESSDSTKVFVLTARHVLLPRRQVPNKLYDRRLIKRSRDVLHLGRTAFQSVLDSIMREIKHHVFYVNHLTKQLEYLAKKEANASENDVIKIKQRRTETEHQLEKSKEAIEPLNEFHTEFTKYWSSERHRVLGHIAYAPPISAGTGTERFTEDWALIELDDEKIDWSEFKGNVIDLGTELSFIDFTQKITADFKVTNFFEYPLDRFLPIHGIVSADELRHPTTLDAEGQPHLFVIKSGSSTGITIGRANGIMSFDRHFAAAGDSGAPIVDPVGRLVGMLTGGCASDKRSYNIDITYATPYYWLEERIKKCFPDTCLYEPKA